MILRGIRTCPAAARWLGIIGREKARDEKPFRSIEITLKLLFELDYRLHSLITESLQPEWQSSNKASSHTERQLMNNNEEQDTIRVTES